MKPLIPIKTTRVSVGDKHNRLKVNSCGRTESRQYYAVCTCECGAENVAVRIDDLLSGSTKSCGCFTVDRVTTHGLSNNPVFQRWEAMMSRCYSHSHVSYANYGGRGVSVCPEWHDPEAFVRDMSAGFSPELQLDRICNAGDYSLSNCRWVTRRENLTNKRSTVTITHRGETLKVHEWAERTGLPEKLIRKRLFERLWPVDRALTTPALSRKECARLASAASHKT